MTTWENARNSELRQFQAIVRVFSQHPYLLNGFFETKRARLTRTPEKILRFAKGFSDGELVLIRVALDIWSGSGNAKVWQLLEILDGDNFRNVMLGLLMIKSEDQTYIGPYRLSSK